MKIDDEKFEQATKKVDLLSLVNQIEMNILRIAKFHPDALGSVSRELDEFTSKLLK